MEELLSKAIEGGSFGICLFLCYWFFTRFFKKEIKEPIEELKTDVKNVKVDNIEIKNSFVKFTENINSFIYRVLKGHSEMIDSVNKNASQMNMLFSEATQHTAQAKLEAHEALERVKVTAETTDKLLKVATITHEKEQHLESQVKQLKNDMIMVKNKLGVKNEK